MPRPKSEQPTPAELDVLNILWDESPLTGREIMQVLNRRRKRAYTSVMSLLNTMTDKGLLKRKPQGRAFTYAPRVARDKTLGSMVQDLVARGFDGSVHALVARVLDQSNPTADELAEIREAIEEYERQQGGR